MVERAVPNTRFYPCANEINLAKNSLANYSLQHLHVVTSKDLAYIIRVPER